MDSDIDIPAIFAANDNQPFTVEPDTVTPSTSNTLKIFPSTVELDVEIPLPNTVLVTLAVVPELDTDVPPAKDALIGDPIMSDLDCDNPDTDIIIPNAMFPVTTDEESDLPDTNTGSLIETLPLELEFDMDEPAT